MTERGGKIGELVVGDIELGEVRQPTTEVAG